MTRRSNVIPSIKMSLWVPEDLRARLDLILFSDLEGKVPFGAYTTFYAEMLRARLDSVELDLSPFVGSQPGALTLRGSPQAIEKLKDLLRQNWDYLVKD